jgi:hypothetical protein
MHDARRAPGFRYTMVSAILFALGQVSRIAHAAGWVPSRPVHWSVALVTFVGFMIWMPWLAVTYFAIPGEIRERVQPRLSRSGLIGRFFVPIYGAYWCFASQSALARGVDIWLHRESGFRRVAPHAWVPFLVIGTWILLGLREAPAAATVVFLLVRVGWLAYMARYDTLIGRALRLDDEVAGSSLGLAPAAIA